MLIPFTSASFTNVSGLAVADGASVEVRLESNGALAAIYADREGTTPLANPFSADIHGRFAFYTSGVLDGYSVKVTKSSQTHTLRHQLTGTSNSTIFDQLGTGAGTRSVHAKLSDFLDVKDFYGTGEVPGASAANDTSAFQECFTEMQASGRRMRASGIDGTYLINACIGTVTEDNVHIDLSECRVTFSGTDAFLKIDGSDQGIYRGPMLLTPTTDNVATGGLLMQLARNWDIDIGRMAAAAVMSNTYGVKVLGSEADEHSYNNKIMGFVQYLGYPAIVENTHTADLSLTNEFFMTVFLCKNGVRFKGASDCTFHAADYELWSPSGTFTTHEFLNNASGVPATGNTIYIRRLEIHHEDNIGSTEDSGCINNKIVIEFSSARHEYLSTGPDNDLIYLENETDHSRAGIQATISGGIAYGSNRISTPEALNSWNKNGDVTTGTNDVTNPFGIANAESITTTAGGVDNYIFREAGGLSAGDVLTTWTGSIWLKAPSVQLIWMKVQTDSFSSPGGAQERIFRVTPEWRRYHLTYTFTAGTNSVRFIVAPYKAGSTIHGYGGNLTPGRLGAFVRGETPRPDVDPGFVTTKQAICNMLGLNDRGGSAVRLVGLVSTEPPTDGTWAIGDFFFNTDPGGGLPVGWQCTTAGSPGTWTPIGWLVKKDTTANRPSPGADDIGLMYMDTTLDADGKPIWWNGTKWIDATGGDA